MRAAGFVVLLAIAGSQAGVWKWDPSDRVNRYEGLVSVESANPEFELLSFTGSIEPYSAGATLSVAFYLPQAAPVLLLAQELQEDKYYRMEAKPAAWTAAAWNTFTPWNTSAVIDPEHVAHDNIGVVVHLSPDIFASGPIAPAFVYRSAAVRETSKYSVVFRTRATMARVAYAVTSGASPRPALSGTLDGDFIRGLPITIPIDASRLDAGPNTLAITCTPTSAGAAPVERQFTFDHRK